VRSSALITLCLCSLVARPARAQEREGATVRADPVGAARRDVEDSTRTGTVIDLRERGRNAASLAPLLDEAPSVHTRSTGDGLAPAFVAMRGAPTAQVTVAVDGVVLNDAFAPTVDLSQLPPSAFSRADVYRGAAPIRLGLQGVGGVIELHTRESTARGEAWVSAGGGSFAQRRASAFASGGRLVRGLVALSYRGTNGDFLFFDDNATPSFFDDDRRDRVRANAGGDALDALLRACVGIVCVHALGDARWSRQPGPGALQYQRTYMAQGRWLARLFAVLRRGSLRVEPFAAVQWRRDSFGDPLGELSSNGAASHGFAVESGANATVRERSLVVEAVLRARYDRYETSDGGASTGAARAGRTSVLAGIEFRAQPISSLEFSGGMGFDLIDDRPELRGAPRSRTLASPRVALRWTPLSWLAVRVGGSILERAPSLIELYGLGEFVRSNSTLENESSATVDASMIATLAWRSVRARVELGAFARSAERLIVLTRTSALALKAFNLQGADVLGVESSARVSIGPWLSLTASYAYTYGTQRTPAVTGGRRIPNIPEHDVYLRADGRWRWLRASIDGSGVSGIFFDSANLYESPARLLLGASIGAEIPWVRGLAIDLQGTNLLDVREGLSPRPGGRFERLAVSDFAGFPLPSRGVYLSLSWTSDAR
jgi:hypothetical protein